jgi:hypoxanthine phosphoribosyltransferase
VQISLEKIEVLFDAERISDRIKEVANQIDKDYKNIDDLVIIGILKGAFIFTSDLVRNLSTPCEIEFIRLSSYLDDTTSSGVVKSFDLTLPNLDNRHVLIVEDIVDSGRTAKFILDYFNVQFKVKSLKLASLFDKPSRRLEELQHIKPDYCCFTIEDKFILGYGLDFQQKFRQLPFVGFFEDKN